MYKKIFLIALLSLFFVSPLKAQSMHMDLNAIYPASNFHSQGAMHFGELVEDYTDGEIEITVHPGGSLGFEGTELLAAVGDASVPMSDTLMGVVSGSEEIFGLTTYPRIITSYEEAWELYDAARPYYEEACERWNQKLLYVAPWPPSGLFTTDQVNSLEDMQGLETRTYDRNGALFLRKAGGSPQSMAWGEVYSALSTGLIDSVLTSATSGKDISIWETLDHFTQIDFAYPLNMVTINKDYWEAMNEEQQEAMLKAAQETEEHQWEASRKSNKESLQALEENGIQIHEVGEEFARELDAIAEEIFQEFKSEADEDTLQALEAIGM